MTEPAPNGRGNEIFGLVAYLVLVVMGAIAHSAAIYPDRAPSSALAMASDETEPQ